MVKVKTFAKILNFWHMQKALTYVQDVVQFNGS